ncbi:ABC transporter ATP-binding protein [Thermofilum pendens]|uniref:Oligopeptide/dipeptide ABC transporter, ATPase subunit n=1 Tax=Thermofilum pendens (strain DSM 2475 / Hrk 5) TaxID=368408 RepID=A1S0U5_THEPD|nr:ABC transporter ATP-binding protein [Thermofilum pendens]ABL79075.1 oligopeptide/dipeptide ABC transporter, ATPase subunit [Thermofilum pendens Hrk 5]
MVELLRLENVTKEYSRGLFGGTRFRAVEDVSFKVDKGKILALIGESGSGKTTIARIILRILRPTSGRVIFEGKDIFAFDAEESAAYYRNVQGIFQDPYSSFNPLKTVDDILELTCKKYTCSEYPENAIKQVLERVGLDPQSVLGKFPHQLSGGQLQRVSIARALLVKPRLLVADEPVSMLDASTRVDILNILYDLKTGENISTLLITHDVSQAYYVGDEIVVLYRGHVMERGDATILEKPLHPYTTNLLASVPTLSSRWATEEKIRAARLRLEAEEETVYTTTGCKYASRCPYASEKLGCFTRKPPEIEVEPGHFVRCWLYERR